MAGGWGERQEEQEVGEERAGRVRGMQGGRGACREDLCQPPPRTPGV